MNKYLAVVRINGQMVRTVLYADNALHARLMLQYQYGMGSIARTPVHIHESQDVSALLDSTLKPTPPMSLDKDRINGLKQNVQRSKDQLQGERDRQNQKRQAQRKINQQHQRSSLP